MATIPAATGELPAEIPAFPLQGALLLPRSKLPLNVFEPRYLAMVDDALGGARLIGMIQPKVKEKIEAADRPELYGVGCAGRITTFGETDDGRYLITLTGVCRFRAREELEIESGFRRMAVDFAPFARDLEGGDDDGAIDRDRLLATIKAYLERRQLAADWEAITKTRTGDLVSVMSMVCPFSPIEKQALLEAADGADRAGTMISLMEMDSADDEPPGAVN
jgi:Lon protease-like protein